MDYKTMVERLEELDEKLRKGTATPEEDEEWETLHDKLCRYGDMGE